ncbi:MAG TPA: hypothetical protein VEA38_12165 [Terriglobales bacterium]|nr:hypothetical protein [Terriglobales bacterium]
MSTLSSSSTLTQVENAYDDNASYAEDQSVTKCRAFITAALILLRRLPSTAVKGSNSISNRLEGIENRLKKAEDWLAAHTTDADDVQAAPRVVRADMRNSRG